MALIRLLSIDNFKAVRGVPPRDVSDEALNTVRDLHETEEMEPWLQGILFDTNDTPHGPSEIVDILTHKVSIRDNPGVAAFILKGKSFPTVRPAHVAHQITRLERIDGLNFAFFVASGNVLDEAKEIFLTTAERLNTDYCILDCHDLARIFIAYGFICPRDGERIKGGRCACGFTPANRTSNILQQAAMQELRVAHEFDQPSGAVILPTGSGKTRVAVMDIARQESEFVIYTAHSHEILESAEEEFLKEFPRNEIVRFVHRPVENELCRINLISIQSLSRNLDIFNRRIDYMVVDEFHHSPAASYRRSIDTLTPSFLLGLTATPFRGDQLDVLELCNNNIIVDFDLRQGIEFGILSPYNYFGCFDDIDYNNIRHNGTVYDINDLERALVIPERDQSIIRKWREKAEGKPTIAFCCSQEHAERVAESFSNAEIPSITYLSHTSQEDRSDIRRDLYHGDIKVLCAVDILNEGIDLPFVECLLFLRPTESKRVFFQQFGRGLRRSIGKELCVIIDFIGNFRNAHTIVEYLGLIPYDHEDFNTDPTRRNSYKDILNLPYGCTVEFDERVIDIFGNQTLNPRFATRNNIARILIHQYMKLERRLGHRPTKREVDRNLLLNSELYEMVFGSWSKFEQQMEG